MKHIWNFFASTCLTVVLSILICMTAAWGSVLVIANPGFFQSLDRTVLLSRLFGPGKQYPSLTLWIFVLIFLVFLFAVNTFVCTVDRLYTVIKTKSPFRYFLPQVVHIGFLVALIGHLAGSLFGFRSYGNIAVKGRVIAVPHEAGIFARLDDIDVGFNGEGGMERLKSTVTILKGKDAVKTYDIHLNDPLIYRGVAFYYADHGRATTGFILDVDGEKKEADLDGGFADRGGKKYFFGAFYTDLAIDGEGRPYSRTNQYRNPYQEIISEDGEKGFLGVSDIGSKVTIGGKTITLLEYAVSPYAVFTINKDPGIAFIIAGSGLLTGAMMLILFIRGEKGELMTRRV